MQKAGFLSDLAIAFKKPDFLFAYPLKPEAKVV
jgi:hypothetical protein